MTFEGSKKVTVKRMKESENELNKRLTFADVANLFRGEGIGRLGIRS